MPEDYTLTKTKKNQVFQILMGVGLHPSSFIWKDEETDASSSLESVPAITSGLFLRDKTFADFFFSFMVDGDELYSAYSPGENTRTEYESCHSWNGQLNTFKGWALLVKSEIDEPDLWAEIEKYHEALALQPTQDAPDNFIPAYEVEQIAEKLSQLADRIEKKFKLESEQNEFVRAKLTYLEESAKTQTRQAWQLALIGILFTIAWSLHLDPQKARMLAQLFAEMVGQFAYLISP